MRNKLRSRRRSTRLTAVPAVVDLFVPLSELPRARMEAGPSDPLTSLALRRAAQVAGMPPALVSSGRIVRKSLDARKGFPLGFRLQVVLARAGEALPASPRLPPPVPARPGLHVVVVGSGPAGTFCALRLSQAGARVTVVEQGKPVQPRRRDLALLTRGQLVPSSNYCFGEGGAGTYSDGKLYTRVKDRRAVQEVLLTLVEHGADPAIAVESRPHIGSNRLPRILSALRQNLEARGVVYLFEETVVDLLVRLGRAAGVVCASGRQVPADAVVLAPGHSARPLYELLLRRGVALQPKPFAVGVRVEHPQPLIDRIQYGAAAGHPALPPAFYHVTATCGGRGVYSFCMCPGGWVVPSATEPEGLCTNGMSLSRRNSPLANAALVVTVGPADFPSDHPLAGVALQRQMERAAFALGGGDGSAPAQRLIDLVAGRPSQDVRPSTYRPRVVPAEVGAALPPPVREALREALQGFDRLLPGFVGPEAQLVGVETRTSAPVRILRNEALMSPSLPGLYPCGEGAGMAGGIVSAAIDGLRVADAVLARG
ncbi:MAG: FAD-binding protein [Myxococcales bacterium]|nr:FAD-binding protein [Myxococcales bacterium]